MCVQLFSLFTCDVSTLCVVHRYYWLRKEEEYNSIRDESLASHPRAACTSPPNTPHPLSIYQWGARTKDGWKALDEHDVGALGSDIDASSDDEGGGGTRVVVDVPAHCQLYNTTTTR